MTQSISNVITRRFIGRMLFVVVLATAMICCAADPDRKLELRAWGVAESYSTGPLYEAERQIADAFRARHPNVDPVSTTGLRIPGGSRTMDMVPMMQIAGDIPPHVLYVVFRQSQTYIDMRLLHPLDRYVETLAGVNLVDSTAMDLETYLRALREGPGWPRIETRVPVPCWPVMRRRCPYAAECPHRRRWELPPSEFHEHVWTYPVGPVATGLAYDRTVFAQHADHGIEMRAPHNWEELLAWAKICHDPPNNVYGFRIAIGVPSWTYANFLYAAGGRVVDQNARGEWISTIDTEAAVEAAYFFARLWHEPVLRDGRVISRGVVQTSDDRGLEGPSRFAMEFDYLDARFVQSASDHQVKGIGPVPAGPSGLQRGELNASMLGIFSGLAQDQELRDAAWAYIEFFDGDEVRRIRTEKMVEVGLGRFVRKDLLEQFNDDGRYDSIIRRIPEELTRTYEIAFAGGVPEPYGENCSSIYDELSKPLGAIQNSATIRAAIDRGDAKTAKAEIREILVRANERINQRLLGNLPAPEQKRRTTVAWSVIVLVGIVFAVVLRSVFKAFTPEDADASRIAPRPRSWRRVFVSGAVAAPLGLRRGRHARAWLMMSPALLLIAMWMYWPVLRGSVIAFQDYSVLGDSHWVGAENFAAVLYSSEFWYSVRVSLYYALLFMFFGFTAPIALALLLSEVTRGKTLLRSIYYMPAVLSGVVVIFLWRSFYAPDGLVDRVLNFFVYLANLLPGVELAYFRHEWLNDPRWALFLCVLPTVWAGMGPGCLIYLAALKTVPDELYEAADIDGAGVGRKVFSITLPSIRALVMINFIGAMIGSVRGAGGFVLAMTGGGPYGEEGGATEVIGLKLFYTTFGYLKFGVGAAMAWVLGAMLIGFTVLQLKRMSRLEFKTAN